MAERRVPVKGRFKPPFKHPTPRERGFRWPAEWEPHEGTWLAWPHAPKTWPDCVPEAEAAFAALAAALGEREAVHLLVKDARTESRARARLSAAGARGVVLHRIPTADSWFRDYGPIVVTRDVGTGRRARRERLALDFRFNAWGGKYAELLRDDPIPQRLQPITGIETLAVDLVLEGGSIEGNGRGTILTTSQCLLNANRNPHLVRNEIEACLRETLGARHVLWLAEGITGDDTDGHIDDIARFVNPTTVVTVVHHDPKDPDHAPLAENLRRLQAMADQDGNPLEVVALPSPSQPIMARDGRRLPASYANFYIGNACVAAPVFGDRNDEKALRVLRRCFPGRPVVPIRCEHLVEGMGTLHCVTQQIPS